MLKNERISAVKQIVDQSGVATVNEIAEKLNVSTMTVRRDLEELAEAQLLIRVHGGAQSFQATRELSRNEKKEIHLTEKNEVAQAVARMINSGETIFLGPGTTNELVSKYISQHNLRIVTNSLPVFSQFAKALPADELFLAGGTYRARSGAFIGGSTNAVLRKINVDKAFVGVNGLNEEVLMDATPEEGEAQSIILQKAKQKYAIADHHKFTKTDFYSFYQVSHLDGIVTDTQISEHLLKEFGLVTKIYNSTNLSSIKKN